MTGDPMQDFVRVNNLGRDADGREIVSLSFGDVVAFTARMTTWVAQVVKHVEASGLANVSIGPDAGLTLFLAGATPEAAAAAMLAADPRAAEVDAVQVTDPAPAWGAETPPTLTGIIAAEVMGLPWAQPGCAGDAVQEVTSDEMCERHGQVQEIVEAAIRATTPPTVSVETAHLPDAWTGTTLQCRLRSWPAAPPDADAFSAGYAGALMGEAADEVDRLEREVVRLRAETAF